MPSKETVYKVFISSPSDLAEERERLKKEVEKIRIPKARFQAVKWEDDVPSVVTPDSQEEINHVLMDCDILCGVWFSNAKK